MSGSLQHACLQAPRTPRCPRLPQGSRNHCDVNSSQTMLTTFRKQENAFCGACKRHLCRHLGQGTAEKLPRNSRNFRKLDSIQVLLTTVRKHENALFGACKMHFCRRPKIHTAPKTNAFTGARKMHFATLPERTVCADNVPKTKRY